MFAALQTMLVWEAMGRGQSIRQGCSLGGVLMDLANFFQLFVLSFDLVLVGVSTKLGSTFFFSLGKTICPAGRDTRYQVSLYLMPHPKRCVEITSDC